MTIALVVAGAVGPRTAVATTVLDQVQDTVDEMFRVQPHIDSADANGGAQTVTAGASGELFAIELYLQRESFTTQDLAIEIHAGTPDGALLATSNPVAAADIPVEPDAAWMLITFPSPATIAAGDVFAIVSPYVPSYPTPDPAWMFGKAATDLYAGGVAWAGSIGLDSWASYGDGSDLAFVTYLRTGPATCDLSLAIGDGDLVDDEIDVTIGVELGIYGFDYPPNAEVTLELAPPSGDPLLFTDTTDAFGDFAGAVVFEDGEDGAWTISVYSTDDPACADEVAVSVAAVTPAPTEPLAPTPAPTASPRPTAAALPDTSFPREPTSDPWIALVFAIALTAGALALIGRRLGRARGPDQR